MAITILASHPCPVSTYERLYAAGKFGYNIVKMYCSTGFGLINGGKAMSVHLAIFSDYV